VLAVGDAAFQKKCLGKMEDVAKEGRTVLFVSHNMAAVQQLCSKAILLESGRITKEARVDEVINSYILSLANLSENLPVRQRRDRKGSGRARITDVYLANDKGERISIALSGQRVNLVIAYECPNTLLSPVFRATIYNYLGQPLLGFDNEISGDLFNTLPPVGSVQCCLERLPLSAGLYRVNVSINVRGEILDHVNDALVFQVVEGDFYGTGRFPEFPGGICLINYKWQIVDK